jgi:hypothetical protein
LTGAWTLRTLACASLITGAAYSYALEPPVMANLSGGALLIGLHSDLGTLWTSPLLSICFSASLQLDHRFRLLFDSRALQSPFRNVPVSWRIVLHNIRYPTKMLKLPSFPTKGAKVLSTPADSAWLAPRSLDQMPSSFSWTDLGCGRQNAYNAARTSCSPNPNLIIALDIGIVMVLAVPLIVSRHVVNEVNKDSVVEQAVVAKKGGEACL